MTNTAQGPLLLVGCGNMGRALLKGWLADWAEPIHIVEPTADPAPFGPPPIFHDDVAGLPADLKPIATVFAIKPQTLPDALPSYTRFFDGLYVSIAAGVTIARLQAALGPEARIVRVMPNTPAAIGAGVAVACGGPKAGKADRALVERLMAPTGKLAWVADERLLDAVTAVSGSGPAYVFHLVEALEAAAKAEGLPAELATLLARETVVGAAKLIEASAKPAARLREDVTSPGGTTRAALDVLTAEDGLAPLLRRAIAAARARAAELS